MHLQTRCTKFEASQGYISSFCLRKTKYLISLSRKHNLAILVCKSLRLPVFEKLKKKKKKKALDCLV